MQNCLGYHLRFLDFPAAGFSEQCSDLTAKFVNLQATDQTFMDPAQPTGGMFEVIPT